jgi:hypothetical protein
MQRKRVVTAVAVLAAALGLPLAIPEPALAASRPTNCDPGWFCLYRDDEYHSDTVGRLSTTARDLGVFPHRGCGATTSNYTWSNCLTSVWNDTAACWHLYDNTGNTGGYHNLGRWDGYHNLGTQAHYNDVISSVKRGTSSSCSF